MVIKDTVYIENANVLKLKDVKALGLKTMSSAIQVKNANKVFLENVQVANTTLTGPANNVGSAISLVDCNNVSINQVSSNGLISLGSAVHLLVSGGSNISVPQASFIGTQVEQPFDMGLFQPDSSIF